MNAAFVSALFGLGGAAIGALASLLTTWLTSRAQFQGKLREAERASRVELFNTFMTEAGRLYGDALSQDRGEIKDFVLLYTTMARMNLVSSKRTVEAARGVIDVVVETYLGPNLNLREVHELARDGKLDLLVGFATACREDLRSSIRRSV